jgi:hypothetical protein
LQEYALREKTKTKKNSDAQTQEAAAQEPAQEEEVARHVMGPPFLGGVSRPPVGIATESFAVAAGNEAG